MDPVQDRPLFLVTNDTFLPKEPKFLQVIKSVTTSLNSIIPQQAKISVWLYSRYAPQEQIEANHTEWVGKLQSLAKEITKCVQLIQEQQKFLPFLKDKSTIYSGWTELLELEQTLHLTRKRNEDLHLILYSPKHRKALISYKDVIRKCELLGNSPVTDISESLLALQTETNIAIAQQKEDIEYFNPRLTREIDLLHTETNDFISYTGQASKQITTASLALANAVQQHDEATSGSDDNEDNDMTKFIEKVQKMSFEEGDVTGNFNPPPSPLQIEPIQQNQLPAKRYLSACKNETLDSLRCFKQGSMGISWRYPKQYSLIQRFEQVGKGLQKIESDIEQSIKTIWRELPAVDYSSLLGCVEEKLTKLKKKLTGQPFSDEIHPILHYTAGLFAWRQELQERIEYLSEIRSTQWEAIRAAQKETLEYIQMTISCKSSKTLLENELQLIKKFYIVIQKAILLPSSPTNQESFYQKLQCQITSYIKTFIAQEGPQILVLTDVEQDILQKLTVIQNLKSIKNYSPDAIKTIVKSLIAKKIIHSLYFSKLPCDPELDILFPVLPQMENQYKIHSNDKDFFNICCNYSTLTALPEDQSQLKTYKLLFSYINLIHEVQAKNIDDNIFVLFVYYCICRQQLFELATATEKTSATSLHRSNTLDSIIAPKLLAIHESCHFPDYCISRENVLEYSVDTICQMPKDDLEKTLHHLLVTSLWKKNKKEKLVATSILANLFKSVSQIQHFSLKNKYIKFLIDRFILQKISQKTQLSLFEEEQLRLLFVDYLKNPTFWKQHYSVVFVEKALYVFLFDYPHTNNKNFFPDDCQPKRDLCPDVWKSILGNYIAFEEAKNKSADRSSFVQAVQNYERIFYTLDPFYSNLFETCLKHMLKG